MDLFVINQRTTLICQKVQKPKQSTKWHLTYEMKNYAIGAIISDDDTIMKLQLKRSLADLIYTGKVQVYY